MKRFEKHLFICENKRPEGHPRGCCADKNSPAVRELFKNRIKQIGLNINVRANAAGCLDACEHGATIVIYPEQIWYGNVTIEDVEEILQERIQALPTPLPCAVHVLTGPDGTLQIEVGLDTYSTSDEVPDPEIRQLIKDAVAEWERR